MEKAPTLDQLRDELRRSIAETSTRAVARELAVSPAGLKKFLNNPDGTLYEKTLRKLIPWYERRITRQLTAPAAEDAAPAVNVLSREMAPGEARRFRQEVAGDPEGGLRGPARGGRGGCRGARGIARVSPGWPGGAPVVLEVWIRRLVRVPWQEHAPKPRR
jgi:hypothetical protein